MLLPELLITLLLLVVCCFAPGFFFVRRLRWSGLEKLCGSIALSLFLLWLAAWAIYVFAPGLQPGAYFGIVAICLAAAIAVWRDARLLFRGLRVRRAIAGYGFLLLWTLLALTIIRVYTGAFWSGDWLEHFQRTLFFLHRFPVDTTIYIKYTLPARPPMMNVLAAIFLGLTEDRYEIFQVVFAFLNLLLFLPCCLAIPVIARVRRVSILPLVALFAMNPAFMHNVTYTWTKSLTAFFVIFAIYMYLSGWRKRDAVRMTAAFLSLAIGLLVHYSAGPYCVFFALHYLVVLFRTRPRKWQELGSIGASCAAALATWFAWSIATYGPKLTFSSNTTLKPNEQYAGGLPLKIAANLLDSFVPVVLRDPSQLGHYIVPNQAATVRDVAFNIYQTNVIFIMGLLGGPLICWLLFRAFRNRKRTPVRSFWLWLIVFSVIVGIASSGERDMFGVGHLTLISLEMLGVTLLSTQLRKTRWLQAAIVAGCAIDFGLGVYLHDRVQHLDNTREHTYYTGLGIKNGRFDVGMFGPDSVGHISWRNWFNKRQFVLGREWLAAAEQFHPGEPGLEASRNVLRSAMQEKFAEDQKYWHGWFARHGGEMTYLGDWFGDSDLTSILMVVLAAGMLWKLAQPEPVRVPVPVRAAASKEARAKRKR